MRTNCIFFMLMLLSLPILAQERILVISGGGARGAWGGGLAQALHEEGHDYDVVIGNSTGSLLAPLVLIDSFGVLHDGYTSVTQKDIFKGKSPFKTKGPKKGQIRGLNAFWKVLTQARSLGNSKKLKETIYKFYKEEHFAEVKNSNGEKEFITTVVNMSKDVVEYKSSKDFDFDEMVNWMWVSANQPVFMSLYRHPESNDYYVDGGLKENVPIYKALQVAIDRGISEIDVIVNSPEYSQQPPVLKIQVMNQLTRTIDIFSSEIKESDIFIAKLLGSRKDAIPQEFETMNSPITIHFYFMPQPDYDLAPNSLLFEQDKMVEMWNRGYNLLNRTDAYLYQATYTLDPNIFNRPVFETEEEVNPNE